MFDRKRSVSLGLILALGLVWTRAAEPQSAKKDVDGVTNFTQIDMTIACGGATKASAVPELKRLGFKTIVNLRMANEDGADVEGEKAAAAAAGIQYFHLPFSTPKSADENVDATVSEFLRVTGNKASEPIFIHCAGGGRAAGMWMIKRVMLDGWDVARARAEAHLTYADPKSPALAWAEAYARAHRP